MTKRTLPAVTLVGARPWLFAFLIAAIAGCRCSRRSDDQGAPQQPPAGCSTTPAASRTLRVAAPVRQIAVAAGPKGTVVLAAAGGLMHAAPTSGREFKLIGTGQTGVDVERDPVVTAIGNGFAAVWSRQRAGADYLVFARLKADATLDGVERADPIHGTRPGVAIASSGTGFAVAFAAEGAVAVRLLAGDGSWLGNPLLLPGSTGGANPALAWQPPSYVVAWSSPGTAETPDASASSGTITTARIDPATRELRLLSGLSTRSGIARSAVAFAGGNVVMAWSDREAGAGPSMVLTAAIDPSGARLAAPQTHSGQVIDAAPALASAGSRTGLAWTEPDGVGRTKVMWARIEAGGVRQGDALAVKGSETDAPAPVPAALAWDSAGFVLARVGAQPNEVAIHRFGPLGCDARP
jgi:hypothetical protein